MNKLLTFLASILIAATGCASPPAVNDVKISQAVKVSPPTWVDRTFTPVAGSLFGFDSSVLPVNVTLGSGLSLDGTTHVLSAGVGSYQPLNAKLTAIAALANAAGWLRNDGAGVFSYTTPTPTQIGATTVGGNFFGLTNPSAITFPRINTDNTVSALDAATFRSAIGAGTGSGSLTAVSVVSTNGFTGNSSGGATPALTLTTSITGLIKGNGTAMSAAAAATDYVAPGSYASANGLTLATSRLLGRATAGTGAAEEITLGSGVTFVGSALTITGSGGGTVTNTGGSLTNNSVVLGAGGNDTKVVAGITTNGTNSITAFKFNGNLDGIIGTVTRNGASFTTINFNGVASFDGTSGGVISANVAGTANKYISLANTGGNLFTGIEGSPGGELLPGTGPYATVFATTNQNTPIDFGVNNVLVAQLTSTGLNSADIGQTTAGKGAFTVLSATSSPPATSSSAGVAGTITWDASFIYVCTATNTWKRVTISTW